MNQPVWVLHPAVQHPDTETCSTCLVPNLYEAARWIRDYCTVYPADGSPLPAWMLDALTETLDRIEAMQEEEERIERAHEPADEPADVPRGDT